jgi:hypothetical protein
MPLRGQRVRKERRGWLHLKSKNTVKFQTEPPKTKPFQTDDERRGFQWGHFLKKRGLSRLHWSCFCSLLSFLQALTKDTIGAIPTARKKRTGGGSIKKATIMNPHRSEEKESVSNITKFNLNRPHIPIPVGPAIPFCTAIVCSFCNLSRAWYF